MLSRLQSVTIHLVALLSIFAVAFHFSMTALSLIPLNPVKLRSLGLVQAHMIPFFAQNWRLFAPDPVNSHQVLMVNCNDPQSTEFDSAWLDITTPVVEIIQRNRWTPMSRVQHLHSTAIRMAIHQDPTLQEQRTKLMRQENLTPSDEERFKLTEQEEKAREQGRDLVKRLAFDACDQVKGERPSVVSTRLARLNFPTFPQRHLPDSAGEMSYLEIGTFTR